MIIQSIDLHAFLTQHKNDNINDHQRQEISHWYINIKLIAIRDILLIFTFYLAISGYNFTNAIKLSTFRQLLIKFHNHLNAHSTQNYCAIIVQEPRRKLGTLLQT